MNDLNGTTSEVQPPIPGALVGANWVAEFLGLSIRTVQDMTSRRELPVYKIGRNVRFHPEDIQEWREKRKVPCR